MTSTTMRTLAAAALLTAACSSKDKPAFIKRGDQIDRARWEQVCGTIKNVMRSDQKPDAVIYETFARFEPRDRPRMPPDYSCTIESLVKNATITRLTLRVETTTPQELLAVYGPVRDLLRDLVPSSALPSVLAIAEAPETREARPHGFRVYGGFDHYVSAYGERFVWDLRVSTADF